MVRMGTKLSRAGGGHPLCFSYEGETKDLADFGGWTEEEEGPKWKHYDALPTLEAKCSAVVYYNDI
jgi:hypothetical protein